MGIDADGSPRIVPVLRLDDLLREINFRTPALLKIDVQGAELIVLRGASVTLRSCELVLLETSLFQLMKGAPLLLTSSPTWSTLDLSHMTFLDCVIDRWTVPSRKSMSHLCERTAPYGAIIDGDWGNFSSCLGVPSPRASRPFDLGVRSAATASFLSATATRSRS